MLKDACKRKSKNNNKSGWKYVHKPHKKSYYNQQKQTTCNMPIVIKASGKRISSFTRSYYGCANDNQNKDLTWHEVLTMPKYPKSNRYEQIKNYYTNKLIQFTILDWLNEITKLLSRPV